jgi:hypothetical protein
MTINAIFEDPLHVTRAISELRRAGFAPEQMEVVSAEPFHNQVFLPSPKKTRIGLFTVIGAVLGGVSGLLLSALTALAYPLPTGGMPILAWWPIGIVTYEATMLGAILATLLGLLVELRLPNLRPLPYHDAVADGGLLLVVSGCGHVEFGRAQRILHEAGAKEV